MSPGETQSRGGADTGSTGGDRPLRQPAITIGICIALVVAVLAVYGRTVHHDFVNYDDDTYVYNNPAILRGFSLNGAVWAFTHAHCSNWHPLTTMLLMLDARFFGLNAGGYHLTSVLFHAAGSVLLFLMLRSLTGAMWRSAFVAAVFAVHPLHVESVAWVAELKDVVSGVFFMLTLWAYGRYARQPGAMGRYAMVALWLALGLMSKPMLVTTPFVLLLLDYWPLGRLESWRKLPDLLMEKTLFFLIAAGSCVATLFAQKAAIYPLKGYPLPVRLGNAPVAYVVYLWKMIWPARLGVFYTATRQGWEVWQIAGAVVILAVLTAGLWEMRRRHPYLLTGWLWYLGMLVPVIGILQVGAQAYADRYTYLPQIGLYIAVTWSLAELAQKWPQSRWCLAGTAALVLCALAFAAWRQTGYWQNGETLWKHTLGCTLDNPIAETNMGNALLMVGKTDEAIPHFLRALEINPKYEDAYNNLGGALYRKGRNDEAIASLEKAIRINHDYAPAHNNLGIALCRKRDLNGAMVHFREAIRINPMIVEAYSNLGDCLVQTGNENEAIAVLEKALEVNPGVASVHNNLGNAFVNKGRLEEATAQYREALRLKPGYTEAENNLGGVLLREGKIDDAIAQFREALKINPSNADAQYNVSMVLFQQGQSGEAIEHAEKAVELQPGDVNFRNNLAWMLATARQRELRDGARAKELATEVNNATGWKDANALHTMAAACMEIGDRPKATQFLQQALDAALAQGNASLAETLQKEIQAYASQRK